MKLGYINETDREKQEQQTHLLKNHGCERIFQARQYNKLLKALKSGDILLVSGIKALNQTTRELIRLVLTMNEKQVYLSFLEDELTIKPNSEIPKVFSMFYHSSNENFRTFYGGRPAGPTVPMSVIKKIQKMYENGATKAELCRKIDVTAPTLDRYLKMDILE
ncbi:MAG: hypothetical protein E6Q85_00530 [Thiothrix sp.]|nr:MAG: hypothetical protein E6Q85_00530 [Thiothrix sp.]